MDVLVNVLPFVLIALVFWLLIIRPASRNQRQVREMQAALAVGDSIILTSGIFGTLRAVEDDHLVVEVAEGVTVKVVRAAIGSVLRETEEADDASAESAEDPAETPAETPVDGSSEER